MRDIISPMEKFRVVLTAVISAGLVWFLLSTPKEVKKDSVWIGYRSDMVKAKN